MFLNLIFTAFILMIVRVAWLRRKGVAMMPKAVCSKCQKIFYGWALKYKKCYCDCGCRLEIVE